MLKQDHKQAAAVADMLSTGEAYKSHGKVIDFNEAKNVLKLNVEKIDEKSQLWSDIWELYCRSMQQLRISRVAAKLFESESLSLNMNIEVQILQASRQMPPAIPPQVQEPPAGPPKPSP
jgi:hypothetical protein